MKVMLSQPMQGRTNEEIRREKEELEHELFIQEQLGINKDERTEKQVDILKKILQENMEEENYNHIPRID